MIGNQIELTMLNSMASADFSASLGRQAAWGVRVLDLAYLRGILMETNNKQKKTRATDGPAEHRPDANFLGRETW